ncbi:MAG TPA: hypothetical protein DEF41_13010 [Desulfovibrio sp.]|nr:hypothetical protein [Desulfovibrio sp.]
MSHTERGGLPQRLKRCHSLKSFAQNFLLWSMAGQKLFLYNERIPRVCNISFNEKRCMFSCRMCPYNEKHVREHYGKASFMDMETVDAIIDSIPNDSYYSFDMSSIGETLEFEQIGEAIRRMKTRRPRVNTIVSTNGVLLTEEMFLTLSRSGLNSLQVSLFAENAHDHRMITDTSTFERVKRNLEQAGQLKRQQGLSRPYLQTFMIECKENRHSGPAFLEHWSKYVDKAFLRPMYNAGRQIEGMTQVHEPLPKPRRYPCIMPWYSTAVRSTGEVLPCYMYHWHERAWDMSLGNIREKRLGELWRGKDFTDFRKAHLSLDLADYPVCETCDLWAAYTDIWTRDNGSFSYQGVQLLDFLRKAPKHRGG